MFCALFLNIKSDSFIVLRILHNFLRKPKINYLLVKVEKLKKKKELVTVEELQFLSLPPHDNSGGLWDFCVRVKTSLQQENV